MKTARIICVVLAAAVLCAPHRQSLAQSQESIFEKIRADHESIEKNLESRHIFSPAVVTQSVAPQTIDVKHYKLQIQLVPNDFSTAGTISGTVSISAEATGSVNSVSVDAQPNLIIDSVTLDGNTTDFRRNTNRLVVTFPSPFSIGRVFDLVIRYHGVSATSNTLGGGLIFTRHGPDAAMVVANLSEPFAAPLWWPCIDNPADKATIETEITVPQGNKAGSNGILQRTQDNADGTTTYFWREDSPLSTYLVSVAASNYERFEDSYTALDGVTTMPLVYYVYPEHLDVARTKFAVTRSAIGIFANLFGEYPFIHEKYGMAEFPFGGAMEHQTLTSISASLVGSLTSNQQATIVHELSHHWWGDLVTMKTWDDIWLNEGFATYSEVLFFENFAGMAPGELLNRSYDDGAVDGALGGTVTAENLNNPFDDQGAIYRKGGWVLHMLRHVMGDQKFFAAMKQYRTVYAFSNATTADFRRVCEDFYGDSLDWFFNQWVYAGGRPVYKVSTDISANGTSGGFDVSLVIKQKQQQAIPDRPNGNYIMPIDITIHYGDGTSETRVIFNDTRKQRFDFNVSKRPVSVGFDEAIWILKKAK